MHLRSHLSSLALVVAATAAACDKPPVQWSDPVAINDMRGPARLLVDSTGRALVVSDSERSATTPPSPGLCATSLRTMPGIQHLFSAWWNVRRDSSAALLIASSADSGKTWGKALAMDTTDISSAGCSRPPPSIATVGDDLFVAYSMIAPEGKGVFFAHSMGSMVHAPVTVIYGDRLVPTAIAAEGNDVAVAYEDPNGSRQRVAVAYSVAQGHIFAWRSTASRDVDVATTPAVALSGRVLAVSWATHRSSDSAATRVVRVGRIQ